jgi:hypothetical protein
MKNRGATAFHLLVEDELTEYDRSAIYEAEQASNLALATMYIKIGERETYPRRVAEARVAFPGVTILSDNPGLLNPENFTF